MRAAGCVYAEDEADLLISSAAGADELAAMVDRRVRGEPIEHVVGWAAFCGLRIIVEPNVFVPRRRTEFLVAQVLEVATVTSIVVDLCCGSGAVGAAIAAALPGVEVYATDVHPDAVRCARRNMPTGVGQVLEGDLDDPLPGALRGRVDVMVANAPYVPSSEIRWLPSEARVHEPAVTLDGGAEGLDIQRRIAAAAPRWLATGGHLLIETSTHQSEGTLAAFVDNGLRARIVASDRYDATVVIGTRG